MCQPRKKNPGYVLRANAWVVTPEEPHPFHTTCLWERYETGWGFTQRTEALVLVPGTGGCRAE